MNPSCRIQRTSCFSVLTPRLLHSQASATGSDKPAVVAVGEMLRRVDNSCLMRWSSYICSHYKYSFLQQLLPARNASTRRSGSAHAKVELHKVTYTFKQADDARAEVAAGTEFPGIRLATVDPVVEEVPEGSVRRAAGSSGLREVFQKDGFVEVPQLVSKETAQELVAALDAVLAGRFDTGFDPDKRPANAHSSHVSPGQETMQVINIWKASRAFANVVLSSRLGKLVSELAGWKAGCRLAQDQVWAKPPGAGPLVFHRDSTYFDFEPADVVTVWLALDDMVPKLGPLEYIPGSQHWGEGRTGSANLFFDKNRFALVHDAARRHGIADPAQELEVHRVRVGPGGGSIHNGRTWHGSGPNSSEVQPRRGLGIHFVPANAKFRNDPGNTGRLWKPYLNPDGSRTMPESVFPITFARR